MEDGTVPPRGMLRNQQHGDVPGQGGEAHIALPGSASGRTDGAALIPFDRAMYCFAPPGLTVVVSSLQRLAYEPAISIRRRIRTGPTGGSGNFVRIP